MTRATRPVVLLAALTAAGSVATVTSVRGAQAPGSRVNPPGITLTVHARSIQPGELVEVLIDSPQPADAVSVRAFNHPVPATHLATGTWRALVGIDLETAPGAYPVIANVSLGTRRVESSTTLAVRAKAFATRKLTVDDAFVNPPASEMKRINDEATRLTALWAKETPTPLWTGPFIRPVVEPANSAFGSRSVFNGQAKAPHTGADFLSPAGTPVKAPAGGTVVIAEPLYYSGNTVVIDHGLGIYSLFAHFSAIDVHAGDVVVAGTILGKVGATGRVTGPHLHWAMRVNGARVDPLSALALLGSTPVGHP